MDREAERWKAEYRSVVEEQEAQTRQWSATRRLLQDMLRAVLNACTGWSAPIDEEIEVLRISVEQAADVEQLETLQKNVNRIASALTAAQRDARDGSRNLAVELVAIEREFVVRLADEPLLAEWVDRQLADDEAGPLTEGLDALAAALIDAFREVSAQKAEAERFVSEVTATLASLESWAADGVARVGEQRLAHHDLHADVDREVSSLKTQVERADSVAVLKEHMRRRFAAIAERISAFRDSEEEKLQAAERQNERLNGELAELKVRTEALSEQLREQQALLLLDALTDVHSRFAYDRRLDEEIAASMRSNKPMCYALWDIDHFKQINDRYGHQAGDRVLAQVAGYLSRYTRSNDFVARIGGEEFVVLFPDTHIDDATMIAEKLRRLIAAADYGFDDADTAVTISCGISTLQAGDAAGQLYERADSALYAAKHAGRNRCMAA